MDWQRRFGGIGRLYGEAALARFAAAHIVVVGVGGVGSWAVEGLARSGIGTLTLIDLDNVAESNVNRQLPALDPHFGRAKIDVLAERVRAINPACTVHLVEDFVTEENLDAMLDRGADFLVDAIDQMRVKGAMADWCLRHKLPFVVSGGAGGRMDPTRIRIDDLASVTGDPLLANLRYRMRRHHGMSRDPARKMKIPCIHSDEPVVAPARSCDAGSSPQGLSCAGYGASMAVTAAFGLAAVSFALGKLSATPR